MAQPSSGTYNFAPALSDLLIESYSRIQIRPTSFTADHLVQALASAQYLLAEWATKTDIPNLWKIELINFPLTQGVASYAVPANVVALLDYYLRLPPQNAAIPTDIVVMPISRTEYADQPNKASQARPTTVWWFRSPATGGTTLNLWPTPDQNGPYVLYAYAMTQIQDAAIGQGTTLDIPYRFLEAFAAGLAAKLSVKYPPPPPNSAMIMMQLAQQAWDMAARQDIEMTPLFIVPGLDHYSRN